TALLLASCGANVPGESVTYAVYLEQSVFQGDPGKVRNLARYGEDHFLALSSGENSKINHIVKYNTDFSIVEFEQPDIRDPEYSIERFGTDESGLIYAVSAIPVKDPSQVNMNRRIEVFDRSGKLSDLIKPQDSAIFVNNKIIKIVIKDGSLYLISYEGIQITDMKGITITEISHPLTDADVSADGCIVLIYDDSVSKAYIEKIDPATGLSLWKHTYTSLWDIPRAVTCCKESNDFYIYLNKTLVNRHSGTGDFAETLINLSLYEIKSYIASDWNPCNLAIDGETFHISVIDQDLSELQVYKYVRLHGEEAARRRAEIESEQSAKTCLRLMSFSYDKNTAIKADRYMNENPDIAIEMLNYREDDPLSAQAVEDYRQHVSLTFMSGLDWDIISSQYLPYPESAESGALADIHSVEGSQAFYDSGAFFHNIVESCSHKGILYILPVGFSFNIITADKQYVENTGFTPHDSSWTWHDFIDKAYEKVAAGGDIKPLEFSSGIRRYSIIFEGVKHRLIDFDNKKADFHTTLFSSFLDAVRDISHDSLYASDRNEKSVFGIYNVAGITAYDSPLSLYSNIRDREIFMLPLLTKNDVRPFTIIEGYALNSKSSNKEDSLKFILYLAENNDRSVPVSKAAFEAAAEKLINCGQITVVHSEDAVSNAINAEAALLKNEAVLARNTSQVHKLMEIISRLDNANLHSLGDPILQIFKIPLEQFARGEISKDVVIKRLEQAVWIYLNE
ncbi:MAG: extracellular solute-binding protein, partial [Eubacteriales bacterium]|nr:extracellular solute-binding protein [Eubacteriales bacterium]